jgi:hypothetical protein
VKDYAGFLAVASLFGILAIILDAIQYFFLESYSTSELNRLATLYKLGKVNDPAEFMSDPRSSQNKIIDAFYWLKIASTGIGGAIVAGVVISGLAFSH